MKQKLPLCNALGQGRKIASAPTNDRSLLRLCKKDRTKSNRELSTKLLLSNGKRLSAPTIRRRLNAIDYKSYTAKNH